MIKTYILLYKWAIIGIAFASMVVLLGVQTVRVSSKDTQIAQLKEKHATEKAEMSRKHAADSEKQRLVGERRFRLQQEATNEAYEKLAAEQAARTADRKSADSMRTTIARLNAVRRSEARTDPQAFARSSAETTTELVPAELYFWADERAAELAALLGEARTRGELCERSYDSLESSIEPQPLSQ